MVGTCFKREGVLFLLTIKACSIKAEFPSKSLYSRMMHLNLPPFNLIGISWPVFYNRCSYNIVEELQTPELGFLKCSFLPCNILTRNSWRMCCSASQAKYKKKTKPKMWLWTGLRLIFLRRNIGLVRLSLELRTCLSSALHALDSFSDVMMRCLQSELVLTLNEIMWPHSWGLSVYWNVFNTANLAFERRRLSNF